MPDFTNTCPFDAYLSLTELFDVEEVSLHSSCIELNISNLLFPSGLNQNLLLPGAMASSDTQTGTVRIITKPAGSGVLRMGDLISLIPDGDSSLVDILYTSPNEVSGMISVANITVLDSQVTSSISIHNSNFAFHGVTNIFKSFDVSVSGSFSSSSGNWDEIAIDEQIVFLDGESSFQASLSSYLSAYMEDVVENVLSHRQVTNESALTAQAQLAIIQDSMNTVESKLVTLNSEYSDALQQQNSSGNIAIEAEAEILKSLDELSIDKEEVVDVCQEQPCEHHCLDGLSCTTCHIQATLAATGTCVQYQNSSKTVRVSGAVMDTQWRYQNQCKPCWGVQRLGYFLVPWKVECCRTVSVPFTTYKLDYHDQVVSAVKAIEEPCIVDVYKQSMPSLCCQSVLCATAIETPDCIVANSYCRDMQQAHLLQLDDKVAELYADFSKARINYTISELKVVEIEIQRSVLQQEAKLLQLAYESALVTTNIASQNLQAVMKQTEEYNNLIQLFSTFSDAMDIVHISKLAFNVSIADETPVVIPVVVTYDTPYTNQSYQVSIVINFDRSIEFILKTTAEEILEHFMSVSSTGLLKRRRESEEQTFSDFQQKCVMLQDVKNYFTQLSDSLNSSAAAVQVATATMAQVADNASSLASYNLTDGEPVNEGLVAYLSAYSTFADSTVSALAQLASDLEDNAIFMWQGTNELLHINSSAVGGETCIGFTDCFYAALGIIETMLRETSDEGSSLILESFLSFKDELLELSYVRTLNIEEAQTRMFLLDVSISALEDLGYWCTGAPTIISQPPPEVNVSIGATLSIECKAQSMLPFNYQWNKDGIVLADQEVSNMIITNIQIADAGEYSCSVVSDAGSDVSLQTVVNVYYAPVFNHSLMEVQVYEGTANGVTLACDAYSWPSPAWSWSYRLSSADAWQQIKAVSANVLTISDPQQENEGWYRCTATNWVASTSEAAFLMVLKSTVVRIKYPVSFDVSFNNTDLTVMNLHQLEAELLNKLPSILKTNTTTIEQLSVVNKDTFFTVSFDLITPSIPYTENDSIETIVTITDMVVMELEQVKQLLVSALTSSDGLVVTLSKVMMSSIADSLLINARVFVCPTGYGLDSNLLFCGE